MMNEIDEMMNYEIDPELEEEIHKVNDAISKLPDEHIIVTIAHSNIMNT